MNSWFTFSNHWKLCDFCAFLRRSFFQILDPSALSAVLRGIIFQSLEDSVPAAARGFQPSEKSALNVFVSTDQAVMREDDFDGDVGGVRLVDKVLPGDFVDKRLRIGSAKFNIHVVGAIYPSDTNKSFMKPNEEVPIARFPATGKFEVIAIDDFAVIMNIDGRVEAFAV